MTSSKPNCSGIITKFEDAADLVSSDQPFPFDNCEKDSLIYISFSFLISIMKIPRDTQNPDISIYG